MCHQVIIRSYRQAGTLAIAELKRQATDIGTKDEAKRRHMLVRCAMTSMSSKLVTSYCWLDIYKLLLGSSWFPLLIKF